MKNSRHLLVGALAIIGGTGVIAALPAASKMLVSASGVGVYPESNGNSARLHNGWTINPAGAHTEVPDMPTMIDFSSNGEFTIVATMGWQPHVLRTFRTADLAKGRAEKVSSVGVSNIWRSMTLGQGESNGQIFLSGANKGVIHRINMGADGTLSLGGQISLPNTGSKPYPGGLAALKDGRLVVVDEAGDAGSQKADLLYILDPKTERFGTVVPMTAECGAVVIHPDQSRAYVTDYALNVVHEIDLTGGKVLKSIKVGAQPNALAIGASGTLFVANSGSDTVSVIDTKTGTIVETISTALTPKAPLGSIPNSLAISKDEKRLYVTNGGNNDVAVIDLQPGQSRVLGFIPAGRYPVGVALTPDQKSLLVGTGKGLRTSPNADPKTVAEADAPGKYPQMYGPNRNMKATQTYIEATVGGAISSMPVPSEKDMKAHTAVVMSSSRYKDSLLVKATTGVKGSVLPTSTSQKSPIEHVIYVIKENRTYDQVFGDIPKGNGAKELVLFGRNITPNHHKLAEQYVLLDNTYCDGEVSQDGWEWSCGANDSDWNTKATLNSYSGKGNPPGDREAIRPTNRYIWEAADKRGLSYMSYGAKTFGSLFSPTWKTNMSQEWNKARNSGLPDAEKMDVFIKDLEAAEKTGKWKNLMVMGLGDDHTQGTRVGAPTPDAAVGTNDLAIGKLVAAVSKSKFWSKTAIFIIEDDAQNGPDHVDAHRTVALVVSPYSRLGSVDSTMYSTTSLLRSMELFLGIHPLSQYDAGATPMFACFTGKLDLTPYAFETPKVDLLAKNVKSTPGAAASAKLDFSEVDLADSGTLNRILWSYRHPKTAYPAHRTGFIR